MIKKLELSKIRQKLVSRFSPQRIILFGSQARGSSDTHSDVDILIISPIKGKRRDLMVKIDRSLDKFNYAFDIVVLTEEEFERDRFIPGTLARYAYKEGRILYEAKRK